MVASGIASAGLGLASAASWGAADFSGGLAARRWNVVAVTVAARCTGAVLLVALAFGLREPGLSRAGVGWAAAASGILSAGLPVLFTAFSKGLPTTPQITGFGLAMTSVWMLSRPQGSAG